jgi:hypothetical protein
MTFISYASSIKSKFLTWRLIKNNSNNFSLSFPQSLMSTKGLKAYPLIKKNQKIKTKTQIQRSISNSKKIKTLNLSWALSQGTQKNFRRSLKCNSLELFIRSLWITPSKLSWQQQIRETIKLFSKLSKNSRRKRFIKRFSPRKMRMTISKNT